MKPFLKWVGGKAKLCPKLRSLIPAEFGVYFEPFVGGGALFFDVQPKHAVLSDGNGALMAAYRGVRDELDEMIADLRCRAALHCEERYYHWRRLPPVEQSWAQRASWFIYLNKTCFNGLWRVNKRGENNCPIGRAKSPPVICDEPTLRACSAALQGAELHTRDFSELPLLMAQRGDFVYFDPPYVPMSDTSNFGSGYTKDGFWLKDQIRLRDTALALKSRGVHVLLSNSNAPLVRELYADKFEIVETAAKRSINCDGGKRGSVVEVIIR